MAAVAALLVERQPNSRVPRRVVRPGSWAARTSQALLVLLVLDY
jgi:hypothetical protein